MAEFVVSAPVLEEDMDAVQYEQDITRGRIILTTRDSLKWELGDIILKWAGPPGIRTGLRKVAADLGITEGAANLYRSVADRFPSDQRDATVPWFTYELMMKEHELAPRIVERYKERISSDEPSRVSSRALLGEVINQIRQEVGQPARPPRSTPVELMTNKIVTFRNRWRRGKIDVANTTELSDLMAAAAELISTLSEAGVRLPR
jgi:NAD-dependent oxidoreductase involved in siderophore biosynthesis